MTGEFDESTHVVLGIVGTVLLDAPVVAQARQPEIGHGQVEPLRQLAGAQSGVGRKAVPGSVRFVGKEVPVEPSVVRHDHAPAEHLVDPRSDIGVPGCPAQPCSGDAMDLDRAGVTLGIDQR
nr:hypothetical protein [Calidifontibacter indicus]